MAMRLRSPKGRIICAPSYIPFSGYDAKQVSSLRELLKLVSLFLIHDCPVSFEAAEKGRNRLPIEMDAAAVGVLRTRRREHRVRSSVKPAKNSAAVIRRNAASQGLLCGTSSRAGHRKGSYRSTILRTEQAGMCTTPLA